MNEAIRRYLERRKDLISSEPAVRSYCQVCVRPQLHCYCAEIRPFDPMIEFVILIHPIEFRRSIATGRMAHLTLKRSQLIQGDHFSMDARVNSIIENQKNLCVVLYPGDDSLSLDRCEPRVLQNSFPQGKSLVIFVIDGTWNTARRTMRESSNLLSLPQICFSPTNPSRFRVRKQPSPECYSSIEAIHRTIELVGPLKGFDIHSREHDQLLRPFDWMVEKQIKAYRSAPLLRRVSVG